MKKINVALEPWNKQSKIWFFSCLISSFQNWDVLHLSFAKATCIFFLLLGRNLWFLCKHDGLCNIWWSEMHACSCRVKVNLKFTRKCIKELNRFLLNALTRRTFIITIWSEKRDIHTPYPLLFALFISFSSCTIFYHLSHGKKSAFKEILEY